MHVSSAKNTPYTIGVFFGLIAAIIWGAFPVITKLGLHETKALDEFDISFLRFTIAGLILFPVLLKKEAKNINGKAAILMACGAGLPYLFFSAIGLKYAPAGHFGVIAPSVMITCASIGSVYLLGDKLSPIRTLGLVIILAGVLAIGWSGLSNIDSSMYLGHLFFALAGLCWCIFTLSSKFWQVNPLQATAIVSVISMLIIGPTYLIFRDFSTLLKHPNEVLIQAIYQGIFAAVLALFFYSKAVNILGAGKGAIFAALVPVTAVLLSIPVLQEQHSYMEWLGVGIVTVGMLLSLEIHKYFLPSAKR